jgi:hypothetical protein
MSPFWSLYHQYATSHIFTFILAGKLLISLAVTSLYVLSGMYSPTKNIKKTKHQMYENGVKSRVRGVNVIEV